MTLPAQIATGVVTVHLNTLVGDGAGGLALGDLSGSVTFAATPNELLSQSSAPKLLLIPRPITVPVVADAVSQELVRTDTLSPQGFTWVLSFAVSSNGQAVPIDPIPFELTTATLDIASVAPLPDANGVPITKGDKGDPGSDNLSMADNLDGTATFTWTDAGGTHTTATPTLTAGILDPGVLPPLAIVKVNTNVTSQAAMLALVAQEGDYAIRTDVGRKYVLAANDPSVLSNWVEVGGPDPIASTDISDATVVGKSVLTAADAATARTAIGLGTAATVNTGTAAGNVPVLDGTGKLPSSVVPGGSAPTWTTPSITPTPASYISAMSGAQAVRYCKDSLGWVNIEGAFRNVVTIPTNTVLFTLPAGMRPAAYEAVLIASNDSQYVISCDTAGNVAVVQPDASSGAALTAGIWMISSRFYVG